MNNYYINNTQQSISCFAAGIIATTMLVNCNPLCTEQVTPYNYRSTGYSRSATPHTFDCFSNIFTGEFNNHPDALMETVSNLYYRILTDQVLLEQEFKQVLHDNLWDLYES